MLASQRGHESLARLLLGRRAAPDAQARGQWTPLLLAARRGHEAVMQALLEHGADLHATNRNGTTVLQAAEKGGLSSANKLLLEHGLNEPAALFAGSGPGRKAAPPVASSPEPSGFCTASPGPENSTSSLACASTAPPSSRPATGLSSRPATPMDWTPLAAPLALQLPPPLDASPVDGTPSPSPGGGSSTPGSPPSNPRDLFGKVAMDGAAGV